MNVWMGLMALATLLTLPYLFLLLGSGAYREHIAAQTGYARYISGAGYRALELVHFRVAGQSLSRRLQQYRVIYGHDEGEFYLWADLACMISAAWLLLILGICLAVLGEELILLLVFAVLAILVVYYYITKVPEKVKKRNEEISAAFPELMSKLALLVNAGMVVSDAWTDIARNGQGVLYEEMRRADEDIENGYSAREAYMGVAERCMNEDITKFISTLLQNMSKANAEMPLFLQNYSREAWNEKKARALQKGQAASSKLMLPIALIFVGILLMILIPLFSNMSV